MPQASQVTVYTRSGCQLCEEAIAILRRYDIDPLLVNIDDDAHLAEQFTGCVPVVVINGKQRFRGRVNEVLLRRLLRRI